MEFVIFVLIAFIVIFVMSYRNHAGDNLYKYIAKQAEGIYDKYAPFSFKEIRQKVKDLGQEYTKKQDVRDYIVNIYLNKFKYIQLIQLWNLLRHNHLLKR